MSVIGDSGRLHQAVANLLANARAHTPAGTNVVARVWGDATTGYVEVRDDGPGFPADLLPRVTDRFARGDSSRSRATGGSGLGLAIVKAVVEAHGGTVSVGNAAPGPGAVVRVAVPIAPAPGAGSAVAAAPPNAVARAHGDAPPVADSPPVHVDR